MMVSATAVTISGVVLSSDGMAIEGAAVKEIDALGRIVNQARTDANGYFTLQLRTTKNHLEVYHPSHKSYTTEIGEKKVFRITLEAKAEVAEKTISTRRRKTMQTDRLLVGHFEMREVPIMTWFDQYSDTLIEVVIPVQAYNMVSEYPEGRRLRFLTAGERTLIQGTTIEAEYPKAGDPKELDTPFWNRMHRGTASEAIDNGIAEMCYFYPKYLFSLTQLETLLTQADKVIYVAADNASGDNYWMFYPSERFARELKKFIDKMKK